MSLRVGTFFHPYEASDTVLTTIPRFTRTHARACVLLRRRAEPQLWCGHLHRRSNTAFSPKPFVPHAAPPHFLSLEQSKYNCTSGVLIGAGLSVCNHNQPELSWLAQSNFQVMGAWSFPSFSKSNSYCGMLTQDTGFYLLSITWC